MAYDAFLYFKDKDKPHGETLDSFMGKHDAFELSEFGFGAENTANIGSATGGGGSGKATFKPFTIKKRTDTASCALFQQMCRGTHYDEAILELRRSGGSEKSSGATVLKISFMMVYVTDMGWNGSDGDDILEEDLTFEYGAIKIEYFQQGKDGKVKKPTVSGGAEAVWSRVLNTNKYAAGI
ncbi:type VI secretion system secreted protein Hcp [Cohaesibacter marisflavi]|uniref:Type VI secretion system secreted protein Hcp n=1 Tax=Cohaesibacter marisflavi TaxID=655353 RepID=A0A1I5KHQ8_9HYPH|nr:type VI secretion system tube protein Hcp [Cohaesibacter marisflavi]SFO84545.1 type VI secretion system secreted protein Hcp [Cohaesibacter marisflavi]